MDGEGIPVTLDECREVVRRRMGDSEYLLYLCAWLIRQCEERVSPVAGIKHYIDQVSRLSSELQSTAYGLSNHVAEIERGVDIAQTADRCHSYAGQVARLRSQCEHTLEELERLLYAAEEIAPTT